MRSQTRVLALVVWLGSLLACLWAGNLAVFDLGSHSRNDELQKIQDSWDQFQQTFPEDSSEGKIVAATLHNLQVSREGSVLMERNAIATLSLMTLIVFGLASVNLLVAPNSQKRSKPKESSQSSDVEPMAWYIQNLEQTVADLKLVGQDLNEMDNQKAKGGTRRNALFDNQFDQLIRMEALLKRVCADVLLTLSSVKEITDKLQRLSTQCEDSSHFAAATRLEWNAMGSKLRQIKESHDKITLISDKIAKQHAESNELLIRTQVFGNLHHNHIETAREQVNRLNEISRETLSTLDILAGSMAESTQDVSTASRLVRGLSERAEEIVNIIDIIDDIAEQTNQLALNASIEAARAGEQGQGFAVVAGEVRNLAARSSTATKSITDLLGTIQLEANHASTCLEKSKKSVELAHARMLEVDRTYRDAVTLSRQVSSELVLIETDVEAHMHDLKQVSKQSLELRKYCLNLSSHLEEHGRVASVTYTESNQLTIHSDRLSRLLNRQYYEMAHCDSLIEGTFFSLEGIKGKIEEGLANAESLVTGFNQVYQQSLHQETSAGQHSVKFGRIIELVKSASRSLDIIRNPSDIARSELNAIYQAAAQMDKTLQPSPVLSKQSTLKEEHGADETRVLPSDDVMIGDFDKNQKVS